MQQRAHPKLSRNAHKSPPTATAMLRTCSIKQRLYANIDKVNVELEKITQSSLKCEYPLKAPRKLIKIPSQVRISPTMEWIFNRGSTSNSSASLPCSLLNTLNGCPEKGICRICESKKIPAPRWMHGASQWTAINLNKSRTTNQTRTSQQSNASVAKQTTSKWSWKTQRVLAGIVEGEPTQHHNAPPRTKNV